MDFGMFLKFSTRIRMKLSENKKKSSRLEEFEGIVVEMESFSRVCGLILQESWLAKCVSNLYPSLRLWDYESVCWLNFFLCYQLECLNLKFSMDEWVWVSSNQHQHEALWANLCFSVKKPTRPVETLGRSLWCINLSKSSNESNQSLNLNERILFIVMNGSSNVCIFSGWFRVELSW